MRITALNAKNIIHTGNRKIIYESSNIDKVVLSFKDITDFFPYSGMFWNLVNEKIFSMLNACNVKTHFVQRLNLREQEVFNTQAMPFGIKITNIISEQYHQNFGLEIGTILPNPLIEFIKQDDKKTIDQSYLSLFNIYPQEQLDQIKTISTRINDLLRAFMYQSGLSIAHMYLSYGIFKPQYTFQTDNVTETMLIDDLNPYNITFWDQKNENTTIFDIDLVKKLSVLLNIDFSRWSIT